MSVTSTGPLTVVLEQLSVASLAWVLPGMTFHRLRRGGRAPELWYLDATRAGERVLALIGRLGLVQGRELEYSYVDVVAPDGSLAGGYLDAMELPVLRGTIASELILTNPVWRYNPCLTRGPAVQAYVEKALAEELTPALMRISVAAWFRRTHHLQEPLVMWVGRTPWHGCLAHWAGGFGIELKSYGVAWLGCAVQPRLLAKLAQFLSYRCRRWLTMRVGAPTGLTVNQPEQPSAPMVAVPYHGKGVRLDPDKNSDLFWVPFLPFPRQRLLVYFYGAEDHLNLDEGKFRALKAAGIQAVAMSPAARTAAAAPVWHRPVSARALLRDVVEAAVAMARAVVAGGEPSVTVWLVLRLMEFSQRRRIWSDFFSRYHVKLYVEYDDWAKERLPADQAIADLGGLAVSYQLADESTPAPLRARASDVHFGFSTGHLATEQCSGSRITQFVAVGYVRDYAFASVEAPAKALRRRLIERGASFLVTFLDENSSSDQHTAPSDEQQAEHYRFLLHQLLLDPSLGVIFKPKKPQTLRQRLGPVAELLDEALATGRCFLYTGGVVATANLPCEAAKASDVAIGLLFGTSAALECALSGVPTLLLDQEGLRFHPLQALGEGRVVFRDWPELWRTLGAWRADRSAQPGFGDWSGLLDRYDPFRDGRAAERIGTYIGWLAQALGRGAAREEAMAEARQRYVLQWGADTVVDFGSGGDAGHWPLVPPVSVAVNRTTGEGSLRMSVSRSGR